MTVTLDSKGGSLLGGMMLGTAIRFHEFNTFVNLDCASACVYAFIGGVDRSIADHAMVSVHRYFYIVDGKRKTAEDVMSQSQIAYLDSKLRQYIRAMGVDADILESTRGTHHNQFHILTLNEIRQWNVTTR